MVNLVISFGKLLESTTLLTIQFDKIILLFAILVVVWNGVTQNKGK